jgi:hypothetical protein
MNVNSGSGSENSNLGIKMRLFKTSYYILSKSSRLMDGNFFEIGTQHDSEGDIHLPNLENSFKSDIYLITVSYCKGYNILQKIYIMINSETKHKNLV